MADILLRVEENVLPNLAEKIRSKTGNSSPLSLPQFEAELDNISGGSAATLTTRATGQIVDPVKGYSNTSIDVSVFGGIYTSAVGSLTE